MSSNGTGAPIAEMRARFAQGVDDFNALRFWEAHESWEAIWLVAPENEKRFYQGLIQLAAAYHHMKRGTFRGAARLFQAALPRLSAYPEAFQHLDRAAAVAAAARHFGEAEEGRAIGGHDYPKLAFIHG